MKPGRNDHCPCGSGKKFKHCCLISPQAVVDSPAELVWRRLRRVKEDFPAQMLRFISNSYGLEAIDEAWQEFVMDAEAAFDPKTQDLPIFLPWLFYQWMPDAQDTSVADAALYRQAPARVWLQRKALQSEPILRRYVQSCLNAPMSFFEVLQSRPDHGMTLRDVMTRETHDVLERVASQTLRSGHLIYGQVAGADGVELLEASAPVLIPPIHKIEMVKLRQRIAPSAEAITADDLREWDFELRDLYLEIVDRLINPAMPVLQTTGGEDLVLQKLVFDIDSKQEAFDALKHLDFEADEAEQLGAVERTPDGRLTRAEITWKRPGNPLHKDWSNTILGTLTIEPGRLIAEVNSNERATTLRKIIEDALGKHARYRLSEVLSGEKLMQRARTEPATEMSADDHALMQSPEAQSMIAEVIARHYGHWVTEALPILGNRTPLETMQTPGGHEIVEALVRDIEQHSQRMDPPVDPAVFAKLRQRMGLPDAV